MSDMNYKNLLQEYLQKNKLPLAKYETVRLGGPDHSPQFQCKLTFTNLEGRNIQLHGDIFNNKLQAEQSAAKNASQNMISTMTNSKPQSSKTVLKKDLTTATKHFNGNTNIKRFVGDHTALFVDVENLPKLINSVVNEIQGLDIYAFVGIHHSLSEKEYVDPSSSNNIIKVLSPSTRTDGTDTCMQTYIGYLLSTNKYETYLIATRDHFGSSLVDMITSPCLLWTAKNSKIVTQVSHI